MVNYRHQNLLKSTFLISFIFFIIRSFRRSFKNTSSLGFRFLSIKLGENPFGNHFCCPFSVIHLTNLLFHFLFHYRRDNFLWTPLYDVNICNTPNNHIFIVSFNQFLADACNFDSPREKSNNRRHIE
jgi:hypothetical protein